MSVCAVTHAVIFWGACYEESVRFWFFSNSGRRHERRLGLVYEYVGTREGRGEVGRGGAEGRRNGAGGEEVCVKKVVAEKDLDTSTFMVKSNTRA